MNKTELTILNILDKVIEDYKPRVDQLHANCILLGVNEWGYLLTALDTIGFVLPPGRTPTHRGYILYPVNLPELIQLAYIPPTNDI